MGAPSTATLAGLVQASTDVLVVEPRRHRRRRCSTTVAERGWDTVTVTETAPGREEPVDLLVLSPGARGRWARAAWTLLVGRLGDDGVTFGLADTAGGRRRAPFGSEVLALRVAPALSEARSILPSNDIEMLNSIRSMALEGTVSRRPKAADWRDNSSGGAVTPHAES